MSKLFCITVGCRQIKRCRVGKNKGEATFSNMCFFNVSFNSFRLFLFNTTRDFFKETKKKIVLHFFGYLIISDCSRYLFILQLSLILLLLFYCFCCSCFCCCLGVSFLLIVLSGYTKAVSYMDYSDRTRSFFFEVVREWEDANFWNNWTVQ